MIWKKIKEESLKTGYRKVVRRTFKLPSGKTADFDIKDEGEAVCVLAFTESKKVILIKQFRPGPERELLELPGGCIEKNEDPEDAAERELLEETGFKGKLKFAGKSLDCAYSNLVRHNYIALNCEKIQEPEFDETEFGEVIEMPLDSFRKLLRSGEMTDIETGYLGLDYLKLL